MLPWAKLDPSASGITTTKCLIRDRLDTIEINIAKMDVAERPGQEEDDTTNTRLGKLRHKSTPLLTESRTDKTPEEYFSGTFDEVGRLADQIV